MALSLFPALLLSYAYSAIVSREEAEAGCINDLQQFNGENTAEIPDSAAYQAIREDNINPDWRSLPEAKGLERDNTMLSARGRLQAKQCAKRFLNVKLEHVFASPFDRTMETASIIAEEKGGFHVKPEPGLCEVLTECQKPPGFWDTERLKTKFHLVDTKYQPIYTKETLPEERCGHQSCIPRLRCVLSEILKNYEGDLLLVTHGAPVAAIHQIWGSRFTYVGQATVSKFVQTETGVHLELSGDSSHLSDRSNLRPVD